VPHISLVDNGKLAGIYLFLPGYVETDVTYKQIGYLLLDESLGEFDVETSVGMIQMLPPKSIRIGCGILLLNCRCCSMN